MTAINLFGNIINTHPFEVESGRICCLTLAHVLMQIKCCLFSNILSSFHRCGRRHHIRAVKMFDRKPSMLYAMIVKYLVHCWDNFEQNARMMLNFKHTHYRSTPTYRWTWPRRAWNLIKMSSVLNVSCGSSKSEEFNLNNIEVLVDSEEENWFKQVHIGKFLGLKHNDASVGGLDKCEMPNRNDINTTPHGTRGWPGPKDQQNKTDKLLSVFEIIYVIIKSQKDKGKALKHILKDIVPRGLEARIEEIQGKHQQVITDLDNQTKALEHTNQKYQQKILGVNKEIDDLIANRHIAHHGCFDNVLCFIKKNSGEVHRYYVIRCQYRQLEKQRLCVLNKDHECLWRIRSYGKT